MNKASDLEVMLTALEHTLNYHEWCDGGERVKCGTCNEKHNTCQDSGVCEGCNMREDAIQALNRWKH